jgi:hypothetical protein
MSIIIIQDIQSSITIIINIQSSVTITINIESSIVIIVIPAIQTIRFSNTILIRL